MRPAACTDSRPPVPAGTSAGGRSHGAAALDVASYMRVVRNLCDRGGLAYVPPTVLSRRRRRVSVARVRGRRRHARIIVTAGALREPPENMRWTVAHELGHVAQPPSPLVAITAGLVLAPALAVAGLTTGSRLLPVLGLLLGLGLVLLGCALSRRAERAADRFALDLLARGDGSVPTGLRPLAPCEHPTGLVYLFETHPRTCERLALLDAAAPAPGDLLAR
ncbi:hypothetical protein ET495_17420 (plasmid) [Xylanimonas allomyrinae]|uniref:Peptidase M48 domain-containing protein n=1 Tax=Xylanimonas allomyrinae TaxID=2509459 RepID=A0A4P6EPW9_9MICO|nr:M48 family metalloprotease [Xylanimonas allomyrinae]QAY65000.1 hypothetical protein ET495_17420 [Xylanimonas allomyrinae]